MKFRAAMRMVVQASRPRLFDIGFVVVKLRRGQNHPPLATLPAGL